MPGVADLAVLDVDPGPQDIREPELPPAAHAVKVGERQWRRRVVVHETLLHRDLEQPGDRVKGNPRQRSRRSYDLHICPPSAYRLSQLSNITRPSALLSTSARGSCHWRGRERCSCPPR